MKKNQASKSSTEIKDWRDWLCFEETPELRQIQDDLPIAVWICHLSNGQSVWQHPYSNPHSWLLLKEYLDENKDVLIDVGHT